MDSGLFRVSDRDYLSGWKQSGCSEYLAEFPSTTNIVKRGSNSDHHQQQRMVKNSQTQFNDHRLFSAARMHEEAKTEQQLGLTLEEISDLHRSTS